MIGTGRAGNAARSAGGCGAVAAVTGASVGMSGGSNNHAGTAPATAAGEGAFAVVAGALSATQPPSVAPTATALINSLSPWFSGRPAEALRLISLILVFICGVGLLGIDDLTGLGFDIHFRAVGELHFIDGDAAFGFLFDVTDFTAAQVLQGDRRCRFG